MLSGGKLVGARLAGAQMVGADAEGTDFTGADLKAAKLSGATLVEMAKPGGKEIILGMKNESGLGKLLMVGLGGIFVEVFKDAAFRFAPLDTENATTMIGELKSYPLLAGTRGESGIDKDALAECLGRLSRLAEDFPEISEIDINPLVVTESAKDFRILDARIMFEK